MTVKNYSLCWSAFEVAWGWCAVVASCRGIVRVVLPMDDRRQVVARIQQELPVAEPAPALLPVCRGLQQYFAGHPEPACALDLRGASTFQQRVWGAAMRIPYGQVRTYGWLAATLGCPRAARAVGGALARNPVPLLVPCHRVVRADGTLGGFTAPGGMVCKQRLLQLEQGAGHCAGSRIAD